MIQGVISFTLVMIFYKSCLCNYYSWAPKKQGKKEWLSLPHALPVTPFYPFCAATGTGTPFFHAMSVNYLLPTGRGIDSFAMLPIPPSYPKNGCRINFSQSGWFGSRLRQKCPLPTLIKSTWVWFCRNRNRYPIGATGKWTAPAIPTTGRGTPNLTHNNHCNTHGIQWPQRPLSGNPSIWWPHI